MIFRRVDGMGPGPWARLVVGLAVVLLGACGKGGEGKGKAAATQVVARVGSQEITVHQLNSVLARAQNLGPEAAAQAKREVLDRLIDQELARQQALARELDRTPSVQQALESAKSEVLARAYLEQLSAALPAPTDDEVKKYYGEHPELFAERRLFNLEELSIAPGGEVSGLREAAAKARSMQDISDWLSARGQRFSANRGVRSAEQLPMDVLPRLHAAKDGDILVLETAGGHQVVRVVASKSAPVDPAVAAPRIRQFLVNQRGREAVAKEMKQLRAGAKIEYLGEFAEGAAAAETRAKADAESRAKADAAAKAKAEAEAQARTEEATRARRGAEDKARLEAEAKERAVSGKSPELSRGSLEKGVGGLR